MTDKEFADAVTAIHLITMNAVLPGGAWMILLLGASQIVGVFGLIWLWTR